MTMNVVIRTIDHNEQRYNTPGDWWWEVNENEATLERTLHIRVSNMGDWKMEMALALHEFFEALVCRAQFVTQNEVDQFDKKWEPHGKYTEPGDDPRAPYHDAHSLAEAPERILAAALGIVWGTYVNELDKVEATWGEREEMQND